MTRPDRQGVWLSVGQIGLGLVLLLGHPDRTSGASFTYLRELADVRLWGAGFVLAGLVALLGSWTRLPWAERWGHFSAGVLCAFLVACFWAARHLPRTSLTGVAAYATLAGAHLLAVSATIRRQARPRLPRV